MMEFAERLRGELRGLLDAIQRAGGGVVFEEFPGSLEEDTSGAEPSDRESSAARDALIEDANRLGETLQLLRRGDDRFTRREAGGVGRAGTLLSLIRKAVREDRVGPRSG